MQQVGKGEEEPRAAVHAQNSSGNKGLGTSHIVYVNIRGKILRVSGVVTWPLAGSPCRR